MAFQETYFEKDIREERVKGYKLYRKVWKGKHYEIYGNRNKNDGEYYMKLNYLKKISKVMGDSVSKNPPNFVCKNNQDFIDKILFNSKMNAKLFEFATSVSALGDGYLVLNIKGKLSKVKDKENNKLVKKNTFEYTIGTEAPENVDIVMNFKGDIDYYLIDGIRYVGKEKYYFETKHELNKITKKIYKYNEKSEKELVHSEELEHNLNRFFIQHVPNMRIDGELYGESDYQDLLILQGEINNRATQIRKVQDYNSDPKQLIDNKTIQNVMTASKKALKTEADGTKSLDIKKSNIIPVIDKESRVENFVLEANEEQQSDTLAFIINQMLTLAEIAPELLGSALQGVNIPESGKALRQRLQSTEAKVKRLQNYLGNALQDLLYTAQLFEATFATEKEVKEPEKVSVKFQSFYPVDETERATVSVQELKNKIKDLKTILVETYGYNEDQALQIINQIKEDSKVVIPPELDSSRYNNNFQAE